MISLSEVIFNTFSTKHTSKNQVGIKNCQFENGKKMSSYETKWQKNKLFLIEFYVWSWLALCC